MWRIHGKYVEHGEFVVNVWRNYNHITYITIVNLLFMGSGEWMVNLWLPGGLCGGESMVG